jgi:hypothetical protein
LKILNKLAISALFCVATAAQTAQYMTTFQTQENPFSEGGKWIDGRVTGLDWGSVQTLPNAGGFHATGTIVNGPNYNDSTAVLSGSWSSDQSASAVIYNALSASGCCKEVELRLRTTITAHSITGYEFDFSIVNGNNYLNLVRWNGPVNSFTYCRLNGACDSTTPTSVTGPQLHTGDTISAKAIGNELTLYVNNTLYFKTTDGTYQNGSPGIGFWNRNGTVADFNNFGFQSFVGTSLTGLQPPTDLKVIVN